MSVIFRRNVQSGAKWCWQGLLSLSWLPSHNNPSNRSRHTPACLQTLLAVRIFDPINFAILVMYWCAKWYVKPDRFIPAVLTLWSVPTVNFNISTQSSHFNGIKTPGCSVLSPELGLVHLVELNWAAEMLFWKMFHNRISKIHHGRENIISTEIWRVFVLQIQVRRRI